MSEASYYACQVKVPRVGRQGQDTFSAASCLIIGMGGLGCPASIYLAGSGIGTLGLCDYDRIEVSNISRQVLYEHQELGEEKVEVAQRRLKAQNPYIHIVKHKQKLNESNWQELLGPYDLILDCSDNFPSKYLIHDACWLLQKDLVQAGIFQTSGQVYYFPFSRARSAESGPSCLRCVWSEAPEPGAQRDCSDAGVMTAVAGTVALQQVNIALLSLLGKYRLSSSMSLFDWELLEWSLLKIPPAEGCFCRDSERRKELTARLHRPPPEVSELPPQGKSGQDGEGGAVILDVRNPEDQGDNAKFRGRTVVALMEEELRDFSRFIARAQKGKTYILVCYKGVRSLALARELQQSGYRAFSYIGGYAGL